MKFRLLGPLEVHSGERPLPLGGPRQRALLAALLFRANEMVAVDDLVDAAWEAPPASAGANVRTYVAALRALLGRAEGRDQRLATRAGGYLLGVAPEELDLLAFDDLVADGDLALREGDPARAVECFQAALALWRGPPLAGTALGPVLRIEVARLQERRLLVAEWCADARLAAGQHEAAMVELRGLVTEHPLREGLWSRLMLALAAGGRQAEALAAYAQVREHLVEELGVEPGPELQATQQEVLQGNVRAGPRNGSVAQPALVPAELPPAPAAFTGRDKEAGLLSGLLPSAPGGAAAVATIDGAGGVGKSALAIHVAHQVADRFPDGQLYVNLQGAGAGARPRHPDEVLARWLVMLGVPNGQVPAATQDAAATFRSLTAGRRLLVVLDNAVGAAQVAPLLPAAPGCAAMVTSRRALTTVTNAKRLHLDVMSKDEAVTLLGRLVGAERVNAAPETAGHVAALCGGLPLAIRVAGGRLSARPTWPLATLAERLSDARRRLDELQVDELGVRASLGVSYRDLLADPLGVRAARAFRLLGLVETPDIGTQAVAALCGLPAAGVEAALERLVDENLVESALPGRYRMHDLLRLLAREHAEVEESPAERDAALGRLLEHQVAGARRASLALDPTSASRFPDRRTGAGLATTAEAIQWVDAERVNLMALVSQALNGPPTHQAVVVQLVTALFRPFEIRGYWHELIALNRLGVQAAATVGDCHAEATAHKDWGAVCGRLGLEDEELDHLQRALAMFTEQRDGSGELSCLNWIGVAHGRQGRYDLAVSHFERSLAIARELRDRANEGIALNNLGIIYQRLGRLPEAIAALEHDLGISRELGDAFGEGATLNNLADAHREAGNLTQAIAYYQESLTISRQVGDRHGEATRLWGIGQALHACGQHEQARKLWRDALAILQEFGATTVEETGKLLSQPFPDTPRTMR